MTTQSIPMWVERAVADIEAHLFVCKRDKQTPDLAAVLSSYIPKVKELEWHTSSDGTLCAFTAFGRYHIFPKSRYGWFELCAIDNKSKNYRSLEKAKSVAQADYKQRVWECFAYEAVMPSTLLPCTRCGRLADDDEELEVWNDRQRGAWWVACFCGRRTERCHTRRDATMEWNKMNAVKARKK